MEWLVDNFVITTVAPRRSGKSYLNKTLLKGGLIDRFDHVFIMSPSIAFNHDYDEFKDIANVELVTKISKEFVEQLIAKQEEVSALTKDAEDMECPTTLLILDDLIDSGIFDFRGIIDRIAERGRHIHMSLIVSSQRLTAVSRSVRINSDLFIVFAPSSISELEKFVEDFLPRTARGASLQLLTDLYNEKYQFLILNATETNWYNKLQYSEASKFVQGIVYRFPLEEILIAKKGKTVVQDQ